ncbi:hypothetical protein CSPX01_05570 [Colletotrichum filicis]|nr:hypothetical protein CSPX01_05570 [Colletotrichum filicis]
MAKTLRESVMESAGWMHACATKRNARPSPTDERRPYCIGSSGLKCESSKVSTLSSNRRMKFRRPRLPRLIPIPLLASASHVTGPLRYRVERPLPPPATAAS